MRAVPLILLIIGLLLLFLLAARFAALRVVGQTTVATVTAVEETGEDYEYRIEYRFVGPDGALVTGATVREELNAGLLPRVGQEVRVRYLPFWPAMNALDQ